jgi:hypothetical protein
MTGTIGHAAIVVPVLALLLASCNGGADDSAPGRADGDSTVVVYEQAGGACAYLDAFPFGVHTLAFNASKVMASKDSCLLPLLDSVLVAVRENRGEGYLTILDSLCNHSDGELGEAMSVAASTLLVDSIPEYIDHLYRNGPGSCLAQHVVQGLRLEYRNGVDLSTSGMKQVRGDLEKQVLQTIGENEIPKRKFVTALLDNAFAR